MTKQQATEIKQHFKKRLKQRYNITGYTPHQLQKAFKKRLLLPGIIKFHTKLIRTYSNVHKKAYITKFEGVDVMFVYDRKLDIVKTALTM